MNPQFMLPVDIYYYDGSWLVRFHFYKTTVQNCLACCFSSASTCVASFDPFANRKSWSFQEPDIDLYVDNSIVNFKGPVTNRLLSGASTFLYVLHIVLYVSWGHAFVLSDKCPCP